VVALKSAPYCRLTAAAVPVAESTQTSSLKCKTNAQQRILFTDQKKKWRGYVMDVNSEYPSTTLHPKARACERISIRISFHHESRVSGSSGFGTRSSSLTDRAATVAPKKTTQYKFAELPLNYFFTTCLSAG
jgi:hypothetical protein